MAEPPVYCDIDHRSLNHQGEELCGDQVKVLRTPTKTIVVLSDGLGSGVKANILARLTTTIIVTMLREDAPLREVVETVTGTLPTCRSRGIAYATFVVVDIEHPSNRFKVVNFDSPPPLWVRHGSLQRPEPREVVVQGKKLFVVEGELGRGDFLGLVSDGVLHAGMEVTLNFGWGWDQVGQQLERLAQEKPESALRLVASVLRRTQSLYGGTVGDDATMVGILAREPRRLMVFTGPPVERSKDGECARRLLAFEGRRVVCGGATANLVARIAGQSIEMDLSTLREDVPPAGRLPGVELVTEGILTLGRSLHLLRASGGDFTRLPDDQNGAVLLCRELLQADTIEFLAGDSVNPYYQNPLLPKDVSIRHNLLDQITAALRGYQKDVRLSWV